MAISNPFGRFFNDPDLEQIEGFINGILTTPVENSKTNSEAISSEFINNFYKNEEEKPELDQLFSKFSIPVERLQRYGAYDEIYRSVQMIKRIVKVYKPYIIQKNPVTGLWYLLRKTDYIKTQKIEDEQKSRDAKQFIDDAIDNFQLLKKLKNIIVHNQLMYGDCFVEVIDLAQEKLKIKDLSKVTILNEVVVNRIKKEAESFTKSTPQLQIDLLIEAITDQYVTVDPKIDEDELQVNDSKFQNSIIRVHKPHNIIILETSYGTILGYLEVNKENATQPANSVAQSLSSITSRLVSTSNKDNNVSDSNVIINKIISHILKKVNASRGNKDSKTKYDANVINDLKRFVIEQNNQNNTAGLRPIEVRFIPVNRMVNFNLASTENAPYGGSLLESLMLPGKLYILSQLSNVMQKLSRAPVTRKWIIDSGSMSPQGTNQLLQKLKRELHNNRVSVEDLSSFKSVSKIMSDSKDLFVLSKNGTRALDVEVSSLGDPSVKVQDLEDSRREIVALSGVPAPYLGYMDVVELREQLIHANVGFSMEVTDIQENVNEALVKLLDIIADVEGLEYKPSLYYKIQLIPPTVLMLQLIEMTMSSIGNIFGIFQSASIFFNPYYFLEKYVPYIQWDEFKLQAEEYQRKIDVKTGVEAGENAAMSAGAGADM